MEQRPQETPEEALDWLLKAKEGKNIKILDPKTEREERKKAKKLLDNFGQKELFPEK